MAKHCMTPNRNVRHSTKTALLLSQTISLSSLRKVALHKDRSTLCCYIKLKVKMHKLVWETISCWKKSPLNTRTSNLICWLIDASAHTASTKLLTLYEATVLRKWTVQLSKEVSMTTQSNGREFTRICVWNSKFQEGIRPPALTEIICWKQHPELKRPLISMLLLTCYFKKQQELSSASD